MTKRIDLNTLTLADWQTWLDRYRAEAKKPVKAPCFRIDNTQFSTARHFGGFTFNNTAYQVIGGFKEQPGAMLGCAVEFLAFVSAKMREETKNKKGKED